MRSQHWRDAAACQGIELDVFFPKRGRPENNPKYKQYCDACPVQELCLKLGVANDEDGVWGGLTRSQRDLLKPHLKDQYVVEVQTMGLFLKDLLDERPPVNQEAVPVEILEADLLSRADFEFDFEWEEYQQTIERIAESFEERLAG